MKLVRLLLDRQDSCQETSTSPVRPDRLPTSLLHANASPRIAIVPGGASNLLRKQILRRLADRKLCGADASTLENEDGRSSVLGGPEDIWVKAHFERLSVTDCIGTLSLPEVISALRYMRRSRFASRQARCIWLG